MTSPPRPGGAPLDPWPKTTVDAWTGTGRPLFGRRYTGVEAARPCAAETRGEPPRSMTTHPFAVVALCTRGTTHYERRERDGVRRARVVEAGAKPTS
ncbi:hypothetical protein EON77_19735, partial [bacterium]